MARSILGIATGTTEGKKPLTLDSPLYMQVSLIEGAILYAILTEQDRVQVAEKFLARDLNAPALLREVVQALQLDLSDIEKYIGEIKKATGK